MVEVGVPPFTERFYGSDALPHVSGARKQQIEQTVAKMTELRKKFTVTTDKEAKRYNELVSDINRVLREYRARVILVLLQSNQEKFLRDVLQATESMVNAESKAAFDLLDAMYMATFDGYMALYDEQTLSRFGRDLERAGGQPRAVALVRADRRRAGPSSSGCSQLRRGGVHTLAVDAGVPQDRVDGADRRPGEVLRRGRRGDLVAPGQAEVGVPRPNGSAAATWPRPSPGRPAR